MKNSTEIELDSLVNLNYLILIITSSSEGTEKQFLNPIHILIRNCYKMIKDDERKIEGNNLIMKMTKCNNILIILFYSTDGKKNVNRKWRPFC